MGRGVDVEKWALWRRRIAEFERGSAGVAEFCRRVGVSQATFYLWLAAPGGDDVAFVEKLLKLGIVTVPGSFLGAGGEGFVRFSLTIKGQDKQAQIAEALEAMRNNLKLEF